MRCKAWVLLVLGGCTPIRGGPDSSITAPASPRSAPLTTATIDPAIDSIWKAAKVTPAPRIDDGAFLRRVSLDLIGRVPSLPEARAFLADPAPDRRARAVDRLLSSHALAEHWGDVYADLLFGQDRSALKLQRRYDPQAWLVKAFDENRGYDQIARALITATGDLRDNGAGGFIASRSKGGGGPEAVAGATARIFLGLQIQCAQCHDHPYDTRWKQEDFYGLVAYFARTKVKGQEVADDRRPMNEMMEDEQVPPRRSPDKGKPKPEKTLVLFDVDRGEARMRRPHSDEDLLVSPRFLGRTVAPAEGESRRQTLARAILGSDLFAKAMVARTWAQLFGVGLVDPWDDLGGEHDKNHPPLLVALARDFAGSGYDIKSLLRAIVLSAPYARSTTGAGPKGTFAQAGVRPLSPAQLFRSLLTMTGADAITRRKRAPEQSEKRLAQAFREYQFVFGDDEMAEANRFDGSVPQSLLLMNGELTNSGTRAEDGGVLAQILAASPDLTTRLDDLFLAAYTRRPSAEERAPLLAYVRAHHGARAAYEDLFFALVTSTEAITNH